MEEVFEISHCWTSGLTSWNINIWYIIINNNHNLFLLSNVMSRISIYFVNPIIINQAHVDLSSFANAARSQVVVVWNHLNKERKL